MTDILYKTFMYMLKLR